MRILIIDDSREYIEILCRYIFSSFPDANVEIYDLDKNLLPIVHPGLETVDLILLDYNLKPVLTGLEVLEDLTASGCKVPVLMITAESHPELTIRSLKAGAVDFIDKGELDAEVLKHHIQDVLKFSDKKNELLKTVEVSMADFDDGEVTQDIVPEYSDDSMFQAGTNIHGKVIQIPGYQIIREVGQGGMSTVYLATRQEDKHTVVLKVLFTEGNEDPQALKRFMQEYTLISCLNHPNVIRIYERGFGFNFAYIAMEYFPNGDLSAKIKQGITLQQSIDFSRQILKGLKAIHSLEVVHRDLKPGNILFKEDDSLTITDFGAAKNISSEIADVTVDNLIVGTPYYMSPEQTLSAKVDSRSDIYSFGVLFYQMLTGFRPFKAKSIADLFESHINAPIPELKGELSRYQPLLDGLLAKDPDERFQTANDALLGLEKVSES